MIRNTATSQNIKAIITTDVETVMLNGTVWIKWCKNSTKLAENNIKCNKWKSMERERQRNRNWLV